MIDRFADYALTKQLEKHRGGTKTDRQRVGKRRGAGGTRKIGNNCRSCRMREGSGEEESEAGTRAQFAREENACFDGSSCGTLLILHFSRFDELPYWANGPNTKAFGQRLASGSRGFLAKLLTPSS